MLFIFIPLFIWYWTSILVLNDENRTSFYRLGGRCVTGKLGVVLYFLYSLALFAFTIRTSVTLHYQTAIQTMMLSYAILRIPLHLFSFEISVEVLVQDCQEFTTVLRNTGRLTHMGLSKRVRVTPLRRNQKQVGVMVEECVVQLPNGSSMGNTHCMFFDDLQGTIHFHHVQPTYPSYTHQTYCYHAYTSVMSGDFAYADAKCLCTIQCLDERKKYLRIQLR